MSYHFVVAVYRAKDAESADMKTKESKMITKLCITLTVATLVMAAWMPKPASATEFGMDYYPYIDRVLTNEFLTDANWNKLDQNGQLVTQNLVKSDLNMMVSMGLTCQRMLFFPHGWVTRCQYPNCQPSFTSDWDEMMTHLPAYLDMLEERGIKLVIASPSPFLKTKSHPPYAGYDWQWAYGPSGWEAFMLDTQRYWRDLVNAVTHPDHLSTIIGFDISNEISTTDAIPNYPEYLRAIYDSGVVSSSKIGFSVLRVIDPNNCTPPNCQNDFTTLRTSWLVQPRTYNTKLTDTHCYPENAPPSPSPSKAISELGYRYTQGKTQFPQSISIVGEYGYSYTPAPSATPDPYHPKTEAAQKANEIDIVNKCIEVGVPYAMHWMWTGRYLTAPPNPDAAIPYWFQDHEINKPNDIVGWMGTKLSLFTNGDMEDWQSGLPTGWSYNSTGVQPTASRFGGATNSYCYRLTPNQPSGHNIWTASPQVSVPVCNNGCPSQSNIYVNAYIRSNKMSNVRIIVHQYDAVTGGNEIGSGTTSPALPTGTSNLQWYSFQHQIAGGWRFPPAQNMRSIRVNVIGHVDDPTAILDTDTVTASVR